MTYLSINPTVTLTGPARAKTGKEFTARVKLQGRPHAHLFKYDVPAHTEALFGAHIAELVKAGVLFVPSEG
jgi:hypothetical protein